jgi:hypothetical protein
MQNVMAARPVMPAPTVPDASTVMQAAPVAFVIKEGLQEILMVRLPKKAGKWFRASAGPSQKKEQDVPVVQGPAVIAGSMADKP